MMKQLLILGCGWVGEELARRYQSKGWQIWATTTQEEKYHRLKSDGIFAYIHNFDEEGTLDLPLEARFDAVITSVPASQKNELEVLEARFSRIFQSLCSIAYDQHYFLSSVGVYPDLDADFDEHYPDEVALNPKLRLAEKKMLSLPATSVFRLGGLFGKQRIFAKYFQGKVVSGGDQPANFVHLDDVLGMLEGSIARYIPSGIYNVVCPEHPRKKEVILKSAEKYMFEYPSSFEPQDSFQKRVSGKKLTDLLDYTFKYPSPLDF